MELTPGGWVYGNPPRGRRAIRPPDRTRKLPKDWDEGKQFSQENPYRDLEFLAAKLNDELAKAWNDARAIVAERDPVKAAAAFNRLAREAPATLKITALPEGAILKVRRSKGKKKGVFVAPPGPRKTQLVAQIVTGSSDVGRAVRWLWEYFRDPHHNRLKRCPCGTFFVDHTRPGNTQRCSPACTWRWWSWARRHGKEG